MYKNQNGQKSEWTKNNKLTSYQSFNEQFLEKSKER